MMMTNYLRIMQISDAAIIYLGLDSHINSSYHGIALIIADISPIFNGDYKSFVEFPYLHADHVDGSKPDRSIDRSLWVTSGIGFMSYRVWN